MSLLQSFDFAALRELLGKLGADGWLLYDFHGINPAATRVLGINGMGTRRFFVLLPRAGKPVAIAHRIELASFDGFPGEVRPYAAWSELHGQLRALVAGKTVAMEVSPADAVPYLDRVPHGVVELIEGFGARVVSSGTLITRFAARWSASELAGHRRAAEAIAEIAHDTLRWAGSELASGVEVRETMLQSRAMEAIARAGLVTDHPPIVGFQANAANPHYEPKAGADRRLAAGDVLLLDLWAGPALGSVFADQTWMGFAGREPSADVARVWEAVRGARDAAVGLLRDRWKKQEAVTGAALAFDRPRSAWVGSPSRQLRDGGRAHADSRRRLFGRAGRLPDGAVRHSHRDQRVSRRIGPRGDAAAAAAGSVAGLTARITIVAHTPAPTAACAPCSAPGNPSWIIVAAIAICTTTSANSSHTRRCRDRTTHQTRYASSV